jgi:carbon storage regulator
VSVLAVSRDKIRLGISAPKDVPVFRKEVYISIKETEGDRGAENGAVTTAVSEALDGLSTPKK